MISWMKIILAIVGSLLLLPVAAFCVFGFLATFEPTNSALAFRIGYTVIGIGCLLATGFLIADTLRK